MKERDIRKTEVFDRYLKLVEQDVNIFFNVDLFTNTACPACEGMDLKFEFEKLGFRYFTCNTCSTLFVNPRPPLNAIEKFYSSSPSMAFWTENFFKPVAEARREKIFRPRAEYITRIFDKAKSMVVADVGAGFGLFLEELKKINPGSRYVSIEPSKEMADICQKKGFDVKCSCLENLESKEREFDLMTAFELCEHLFDPGLFFKKIHYLLKPGGYFLMTTLNSKGFDISVLWENSKAITPPHHINFFNPVSIRLLLEKIGFEIVEISTPGRLDWDIVENVIRDNGKSFGRFWDLLAKEGSEDSKRELQEWISKNNMSSHMRVLVKKKESSAK